MGGNARDKERRVFARLLRLHPLLANAQLLHHDERGLDGIMDVRERRIGFQLTELFTEGTTDRIGGSTAVRVEKDWLDLGPMLHSMLRSVPALNRASLTIRFRTHGHLHPDDLPRRNERQQFIDQLRTFLQRRLPRLNRNAVFGNRLRPARDGALIVKYLTDVLLSWRDVSEDAVPHVEVVGLNHAIRMGADVMTEAFERKASQLTRAILPALNARHHLDEFYLVLGGDPEGARHTKQLSGDYPSLLHALTFMGYVLKDAGFDGIVVFHDWGDALSVFCTLCIRNHQALHNWRAKKTLDNLVAHRCAWLKLKGPTRRFVGSDFRRAHVNESDENRWMLSP